MFFKNFLTLRFRRDDILLSERQHLHLGITFYCREDKNCPSFLGGTKFQFWKERVLSPWNREGKKLPSGLRRYSFMKTFTPQRGEQKVL